MKLPKVLSCIFLVDALADGTFRYRVVGTAVEEFYQVGSFAGHTPEEKFGDTAERALIPYRHVRDTGEAFLRGANLSWVHDDRRYVAYEVMLLPLSDDGKAVNMLLGVHDFVKDPA